MTDKVEIARVVAEISRKSASSDPFAAAVRATRMPMIITDPKQPDNPIVFVNDAFSKLTGYAREEIVGRNCRFLQGPNTDPAQVEKIRKAIKQQVPVEIELLNHKKNGEVFYNRLLVSPVFDDGGALLYFFASQFDVTIERDRMVRLQHDRDALEAESGRRADELRRAEDRMKFLLKAGRFGSWTLDLAEQRLVASDVCKQNFGRRPQDPFSYQDLIDTIFPADRKHMHDTVQASIANNTDYDVEYRVVVDKQVRWVQIRGQTFYRTDGAPLGMAGISIDITDRKRMEEHREILTGELNHRVKNTMATIQAMVHQTLRSARSVDEARENLDARLQSLAIAHDVLTFKNWESATIAEIVRNALLPFRQGDATSRFSVGGPEVEISPKATLALAMTLHELATNALKYGALSNEKGRVIVHWDIGNGDMPARLLFRWQELDGPPVEPPSRSGFGSRMIERMLGGEVGANTKIDYRPYGVLYTIEANLDDLKSSSFSRED